MLFNIVLLLHFVAFLVFAGQLLLLYPQPEKRTNHLTRVLGIALIVTGCLLVAFKYPAVNYFKVVPKLGIFILCSVLIGIYSGRTMPEKVYKIVFGLVILAGLIAVVKV
ncbi:hypothetical protein [Chitinophaga pinensis]|uniref:Uncharacterized protein n=1 Tax=Chitinophaga pinensis TaxID=79329 RepID=A0A5C6LQH1_9BACT|nr:hypothetical protein [Chitinophaga pinensis]TWV99111.1 hypothetical protein FEF09_17680 [Chitinophaga pinensis]